jgi:tetratricopeptide (TPR) repeat protein
MAGSRQETLMNRYHHATVQDILMAVAKDPDNLSYRQLLARKYLESKRPQDALREGKAALLMQPDNPDTALLMGAIYTDLGQWREAEMHLMNHLEASPTSPEGLYLMGRLYHQTGQLDDSQRLLESAQLLTPHEPRIWRELGGVYEKQNMPMQARHAQEQALQLDPTDKDTRLKLVRQYQAQQHWHKVLDHAHVLQQQEPDNPEWPALAARAARQTGSYEIATRMDAQADMLQGPPTSRKAREVRMRQQLMAQQALAPGSPLMSQGLQLHTAENAGFYTLESIQLILNQSPDPMRSLFPNVVAREQILRQQARNVPDHVRRYLMLTYIHHHPEAGEEARQAIAYVTDDPVQLVQLGEIFLTLGKKELAPRQYAFECFDRVLAGSPDTPLDSPERMAAFKGLTELATLEEVENRLVDGKHWKFKGRLKGTYHPNKRDDLNPVSKTIFLSMDEGYHRKLAAHLMRRKHLVPAWHQQLDTLYLSPLMHTQVRRKDFQRLQDITDKLNKPTKPRGAKKP